MALEWKPPGVGLSEGPGPVAHDPANQSPPAPGETGVSDPETKTTRPSAGMESLLGVVQLRIGRCEARFEIDGLHRTECKVAVPGALLGRAPDADVRLVGAAAERISRHHLLLRPSGRQWLFADVGSVNGTWEEARDGSWRRVQPDLPAPVVDGMWLRLGPKLVISLEVVVRPPEGGSTPGSEPGPGQRRLRIREPELEEVARALLARRRLDPRDRSAPSADELAATLFCARATVYRRLDALRDVLDTPPAGKRTDQLADALQIDYPYLRAPPLE